VRVPECRPPGHRAAGQIIVKRLYQNPGYRKMTRVLLCALEKQCGLSSVVLRLVAGTHFFQPLLQSTLHKKLT